MLSSRSFIGIKNICQLTQFNVVRNLSKSVKNNNQAKDTATTKKIKSDKPNKSIKSTKSTKHDKTTKSIKNCKGCDSCKCNTDTSSQINDLVLKEKQIDHNSLTWILTLMDKDRLKLTTDQLGDYHGHSGGSWSWTNYQIKIIKEKGFNYWFYKTGGPLGYGHEFKKNI